MLGVYVHVPWCVRRCPYCDFYFEIGDNTAGFVQAIQAEWLLRASRQAAHSLYFGGGTPSLLSPDQVRDLVLTVPLIEGAEITLEMNPEHASESYLVAIRQAGVNRLSLGVQSFDDAILRQLGRKHRASDAMDAVKRARQAGFDRISADLIIGVPGEDLSLLASHVDLLCNLGVGHVSIYCLTIEPHTPLSKQIAQGRAKMPDDDVQADAYENAQRVLTEHGLMQYEVASFAQTGHEGVHNRIYWSKGSYIGLGPGAHSMQLLDDGSVCRRHTTARLAEWLKSPADASPSEEILEPEAAFREAVAFGLRDMGVGIDLQALAMRHKVDVLREFNEAAARFEELGWLVVDGPKWSMTPLGARFADAMAREFLA